MGSSKLTDEELIELAKTQIERDDDLLDVGYYQDCHLIRDGNYKLFSKYLHYHYKKWSVDPVSLEIFVDMLKLEYKNYSFIFLDRDFCNINLEKVIGDYVKEVRKIKKEERLRKVSSIKPKIKCED